MRRMLAWLAGAAGVIGLVRARLVRARRSGSDPAPEVGSDPRADELRRRLAEAKPLAAAEPDEADAADTPVDEAPDPAPDERRAEVHARAQAAIDEMRRSATDEGGDPGGETARDA
jgi:hypothetical protein